MFLPLFVETKRRVAKRNLCTCSPLVDTPPKRSAKIGNMDFEPTKKWLVGDIYNQACSYHTQCNHNDNSKNNQPTMQVSK